MRIVVISDSHRNKAVIRNILDAQVEAKDVFFLGDVTPDMEDMEFEYLEKRFHIVSGNCDYCSFFPTTATEKIGNIRIFYTHGHTLGVKGGVGNLIRAAKQNECNIALYGHTHISQILYEDGVYVVNPGSCAKSRDFNNSYAVIDIEENGIMPIIIKI